MTNAPIPPPRRSGLAGWASDFLAVLRFYSRLPAPVMAFETNPHGLPDFTRAAWAIPLVGVLIGMTGAAIGLAAYLAGISMLIAATLTIGALVMTTGAFHEDGLADCCDGFWGGATRERRLEIMKDSRVGTFGAAAVALSLALRIFALAELFRLVGPMALVLVIGIAALSRPLALLPVLMLTPAQGSGLAAGVPMPGIAGLGIAVMLGLVVLGSGAFFLDLLPGVFLTLGAALGVLALGMVLAQRKIGGYTGDVLGACQQLIEITLLIGLSAVAGGHGPV